MSCSKEDLVNPLRELLTKYGIHNARVNVEILPPARRNENGISVQRDELTISIQERSESEMPLIRDEPVRQLLDSKPRVSSQQPYVFQEQSEFSTQSITITTAGLPGMESINNVKEYQEDDEIKEKGKTALLSETARPSHGFDQPLTTTTPTLHVEKKSTDVHLKPPQQSSEKDDDMYEIRKSGDTGIAQSQSQIVPPHPPEVCRGSRNSRSSITSGTPGSRTGSVAIVEESRKNSQECSSPGSVLSPETGFSLHFTESTEPTERSIGISNSRKVSAVQLLESPRLREEKHQPFFGDNGVAASPPSILLSSTSLKVSQAETSPRGSQSDGVALKLPPVNERKCSGTTPVKTNNIASKRSSYSGSNVVSDKQNKTTTTPTETSRLNSKQRLQEMLEEQRRMEQMSAQSRARHEELLQEAEKYLQELQQEATGSTATAATGSPSSRIELRTARSVSPRGTSTSDLFSSAAPRSPSSHTLGGSIKVVKFTLPQGGRAKDEAVTQLSSSPSGAQHVSSKDKFSTLLREQEKMLRANDASEREYQKLLEQAIEYHKQQKYIKEMEKQHGENMKEQKEGA
ncbi:hypothetical protein LSM04_003639 [Trypanosoma melophagium]|uniref:uncharacterized protein n=1 Tax=Trypanosoma melophagium TaxID=715481 RepID=UPI00351A65C9|nr:hypothetical protein LSM04_003639 [Trypanosoma melophagium]